MSKYDNEFDKVNAGLPPETTQEKSKQKFFSIFFVVGAFFAAIILFFGDALNASGDELDSMGYFLQQIINTGIISFLVGSVQSIILKTHIQDRRAAFISFSLVGGVVAGIVGGFLLETGIASYGIGSGLFVGLINGAIAGGLSSSLQNNVMGKKKHANKWFQYSVFSWAIVYSLGWAIAFSNRTVLGLAGSVLVLMIASGISLLLFINNTPEIEFS
jgi:hypothetical protein